MTADSSLPRRFGTYLLTAELGRDVLGRVFRALKLSGERGFARVRVFESPEISEDAVLDAIEENGEIHSFLKNPAIARGVQMDAADGVPFLAWNEPSGRTLDALIAKAREQGQGIPVEHALLIGEKVATALDHAYNTTLDGERTLHGLVWPGFVSITDDGETRLTGFGLAAGFFPSMSRPRFSREIAPYLAPEERAHLAIGKNSDVYSVGVLLFELLFGRLPSLTDPLGDVKTVSLPGGEIPPEAMAVLRTCLSPADSRYQSSGELRRELGKILFSGPYSPSTFNLAFFLTSLFGAEIEAENLARSRESTLDLGAVREGAGSLADLGAETPAVRASSPESEPEAPPSRRSYAVGGALLLAAALAGTIYMITRRPPRVAPAPVKPVLSRTVATTVSPVPEPTSPPTTAMSEGQFKDEVARRVTTELRRLEDEMRRSKAQPAPLSARASRPAAAEPVAESAVTPSSARKEAAAEPTAPPIESAEPTAAVPIAAAPTPPPERKSAPAAAAAETSPADDSETPPAIARVIKPIYPPMALRARIRGIVLLRVLVSETGSPEEVEVLKGVNGLTEAAVSAVRRWTFQPGRKNGVPVRAWTTIPIPFEP